MSTMLYILGVALVVFVLLGSVRRPELLRAPPGDLSRNAVYATPFGIAVTSTLGDRGRGSRCGRPGAPGRGRGSSSRSRSSPLMSCRQPSCRA